MIELLIVIAIVGLSVSLVGPSLFKQYQKVVVSQKLSKVDLSIKYLSELAFYNYKTIEVSAEGKLISARFLSEGKLAGADSETDEEALENTNDAESPKPLLFKQEFDDVFIRPMVFTIDSNGIPSVPSITVTLDSNPHELRLHHVIQKTSGNDTD